jgi:hypothetical protein
MTHTTKDNPTMDNANIWDIIKSMRIKARGQMDFPSKRITLGHKTALLYINYNSRDFKLFDKNTKRTRIPKLHNNSTKKPVARKKTASTLKMANRFQILQEKLHQPPKTTDTTTVTPANPSKPQSMKRKKTKKSAKETHHDPHSLKNGHLLDSLIPKDELQRPTRSVVEKGILEELTTRKDKISIVFVQVKDNVFDQMDRRIGEIRKLLKSVNISSFAVWEIFWKGKILELHVEDSVLEDTLTKLPRLEGWTPIPDYDPIMNRRLFGDQPAKAPAVFIKYHLRKYLASIKRAIERRTYGRDVIVETVSKFVYSMVGEIMPHHEVERCLAELSQVKPPKRL